MIGYNELAKVSAVETIQNEPVVSKWVEESFHFGPRKSAWHWKSWKSLWKSCLALEILLAVVAAWASTAQKISRNRIPLKHQV